MPKSRFSILMVSVPEYGFSVNASQRASVHACHNRYYTEQSWVIEVCYINDPKIRVLLHQFYNEGDMNSAYTLLLERLPDDLYSYFRLNPFRLAVNTPHRCCFTVWLIIRTITMIANGNIAFFRNSTSIFHLLSLARAFLVEAAVSISQC